MPAAVAATRAAAEAQCPCAAASSHKAYIQCVAEVTKTAAQSGSLPKQLVRSLDPARGPAPGNEERRVGPPLVTVAVSFFLAEMGDKTQLATAALAAQATSLVPVWLGSVLGMILADGLAVAVGHLLGRRLPERPLKIGAAALFLLVGILLLGTRTVSDTAPLPGSISVRPGLGEYIQSGSGMR
jgi:putative Ca2+/H+ antiporter (TMEM165/GDT1 family)